MELSIKTSIIQVTNIAPEATLDQMKTLFGYLGNIEDVKLYPSENYFMNSASKVCYIRYSEDWSVGVALHLANTVFIDRALIVVPFVQDSIPDEMTAMALCFAPSGLSGSSSLINQVIGIGKSQMITTIDPRLTALGLPEYPPLPANTDPSKIEEIRRTIHIGNLELSITAEQLLKFFNQIGEVKYVRMAGEDGETKCAFVEFTDQATIVNVLQYNGVKLGGKPLRIAHSTCAIIKPQAKSSEAAKKEIEDAMKQVKDAQSVSSVSDSDKADKRSRRGHSRSRSSSRSHERSSSRSRKKSRSRSHSRRSSKHSKSRHRSRSRKRSRSKHRSRSGHTSRSKRKSRSRHRSKSPGRLSNKTSKKADSRSNSSSPSGRSRSASKRSTKSSKRSSRSHSRGRTSGKTKERHRSRSRKREKSKARDAHKSRRSKSRDKYRSRSRSAHRSRSSDHHHKSRNKRRSRSGARSRSPRKKRSTSRSRSYRKDLASVSRKKSKSPSLKHSRPSAARESRSPVRLIGSQRLNSKSPIASSSSPFTGSSKSPRSKNYSAFSRSVSRSPSNKSPKTGKKAVKRSCSPRDSECSDIPCQSRSSSSDKDFSEKSELECSKPKRKPHNLDGKAYGPNEVGSSVPVTGQKLEETNPAQSLTHEGNACDSSHGGERKASLPALASISRELMNEAENSNGSDHNVNDMDLGSD